VIKIKKIFVFIMCISFMSTYGTSEKSARDVLRRAIDTARACYIDGRYQKALMLYNNLCGVAPGNRYMFLMRAKVLKAMGKIDQAMLEYKRIIALYPDCKSAYKDLGFCYFLLGDFDTGYKTHRMVGMDGSRGFKNGKSNFKSYPKLYDGRVDIAGKTIVIMDENGYGDFFQWIRYAKVVKEMGATVIVVARKGLIPLLSHCPYIDELIVEGVGFPEHFDYKIYSGELYRVFRSDEETIPTEVPYLYPDEKLEQEWGALLSKDKSFKIGICWEPKDYFCGEAGMFFKKERAAPLSVFYPLSKLENVTLYSLQKFNGIEQLYKIPKDFQLNLFHGNFDKTHGRFSDTAAVMKNLDLVITIDTSIAHLAGALGVPVWVMLPKVPDWRWMLERDDSPWYPTMRLFRQKNQDSWESVMSEIIENLKKIVNI